MTAAEDELRGRVVFLVGARRSGTNWLHSLLALHPQLVRVPSETHLFFTLGELQQRFQHGLIGSPNTGATYLPREDMIEVFRDLADRAFSLQMAAFGGPDQLLVERTPLHALHLDLISEIYPDAPVIHLIRDGHEVALSMLRQPWGPASAGEAAQEWVDTVTAARSQQPARYYEVRHEDLVSDVVATMAKLFGFLGLDTSDAVSALLQEQASRPVNRTPPDLRDTGGGATQLAEIEEVAGPLLQELGYATDLDTPRRRRSPGSRLSGMRSPAKPARGSPNASVGVGWDELQRTVDQFLAALTSRDPGLLAGLLTPAVEVRLRDSGRELHGRDGVELVAAALIEAASPSGTQVRGDSFSGRPAFTVVWSHDNAGEVTHRVLVVALGADGLITKVDYYRMAGTHD